MTIREFASRLQRKHRGFSARQVEALLRDALVMLNHYSLAEVVRFVRRYR